MPTSQQKPTTLSQLLRKAAKPLWGGLSYERTAYSSIEQFIKLVGDLSLDQVTTEVIDEWKEKVGHLGRAGRPLDPSTINRKQTNIHSLLKYAHDREWIEKMPKFSWNKEDEGRIRWIDEEEEKVMFHVLESMGEHNVALFLRALLETGMRRSELYDLQLRDVKNHKAHLWDTKTGKARTVPLTEAAEEAIRKGLPWQFSIKHLDRTWAKLRIAMGLEHDPDFVLHTLRHTAATRLLSKTGNVAIVQKLLGHKRIETTLRYAHISDDELMNAVRGGKKREKE